MASNVAAFPKHGDAYANRVADYCLSFLSGTLKLRRHPRR
jgi:hypothetical protein